ncbi:trypsin-like serine protease [Azospirillum sp. SYSU D00513]|uniref:S1 family peptidase n=1 Tax=Azospirillum sp. SYSU D00513 TaxID=2812561 RepID=UPI001A97A7C4|nr:trypsin-like serine protease [Azospirillum sp. SYSU D00513]
MRMKRAAARGVARGRAALLAACLLASPLLSAGPARAVIEGSDVREGEAIAASAAAVKLGDAGNDFLGLCSAALIADGVLVTAAHCIQGDPAHSAVLFGTDINHPGAERREVLSWTLHPNWERHSQRDRGDIALVRFRGTAPAGARRMEILSGDMTLTIRDRILLAGYGIDDARARSGVGVLRQGTTRIVHPRGKTEMVVSARGGRACSGDSGGPVYVEKSGRLYLLGVISFVSGRACRGPGVITDALSVRDWITGTAATLAGP